MALSKAELARKRNTAKWQLKGGKVPVLQDPVFTDNERNLLKQVENLFKLVLRNWDINSIELGLTPLPKCEICGEPAKKKRGDMYVCNLHYKYSVEDITKLFVEGRE